MSNHAGIDVGVSGAICIQNDKGKILDLLDMPCIVSILGKTVKGNDKKKRDLDGPRIKDLLREWEVMHCFIEKAHVMPSDGKVGVGNYMMGYGILMGLCIGLEIPYTLVTSQSWKKKLMFGMGGDKGESIIRAKQLFPELKLDRKRDHGQADAVLIAEYGRQNLT